MALLPQRWHGANPMAALRCDMNRLFEDCFGREGGLEPLFGGVQGWAPALDVAETDDAIIVKAETPGIDPGEIEVSVTGDLLTIKGEKKEEKTAAQHRVERRYGRFERTVAMPGGVDPSKVSAGFNQGVLTVTLPKREASKRKSVKIKVNEV